MLPIIENTPPPALKGKYIKIKYCTQLPTVTPQFAFFCNLPQYVKEPYKKDVECAKTFDNGDHGILTALLHADIGVLVMGAQLLRRCLPLFTVNVGNDDIGRREIGRASCRERV